eukprot:CAMPEP_0206431186 /NCGR_PEP_ID=MMETSP0324_2-20121206/7225_1 /ASSEMBLY_ACC=CAM_ASM_000836 /TAXON_ID=2866 /ORGANISM="Crypthecodinium cohnii, Strain Seligo" /LENGTH=668 /DNA_ID=CAMNT_0053897087 /DNA_START=63 /DNA_END=2069 /DNA_ORIENTATION=+
MATSSSSSKRQAAAAAVVGVSAVVALGCLIQRARKQASREPLRIRLLFGSTTGNSEKWARQLSQQLQSSLSTSGAKVVVVLEDLKQFVFDSLLESNKQYREVVLVLLSTEAEGKPPQSCAHFCELLHDHVHDFRVGKTALSHLHFAVLGFGSSDYEAAGHYCTAALKVDEDLGALSGKRLMPVARVSDTMDGDSQVSPWTDRLLEILASLQRGERITTHDTANAVLDLADGEASDSEESTSAGSPDGERPGSDVEDAAESCGGSVLQNKGRSAPREMVTKRHREQLVKEGYKIIGSHSAVKLCRWTKHQLRGRGGCYKHSFYGITSYQCMEATPSLACANKCVFCWRHHKNPTGTEWRWKMDDPVDIVTQGVEQHQKMINEARGIPGVKPERLQQAMMPRHCALSLVGEPIMYPRINELVDELHRRRISTFMVTNAQFPEAMDALHPVTQLYISVDAGTKEGLKEIDRPIFSDYWDRYLASMKALARKQQRTTYRLTLVKDRNMSEAEGYAKLVALGQPDFIEIKSVTFCGESKASNLTICNVPWHEEVKTFAEAMLAAEGLEQDYELACEHQHSCIVLIANKKFKIDGQWHTWINYDRFHELVDSGEPFTAMDYSAPTPEWALYGSKEQGFDPEERRVFHNRTKRKAAAGELSEAQLRQYPVNPADT